MIPPHPAGATKRSVAICYGEQLMWIPNLTTGYSSFVNASSLLIMFYLKKHFYLKWHWNHQDDPFARQSWGPGFLGVGGRRQGCCQMLYWHICLRKGCLTPPSRVHRRLWLKEPSSQGSSCPKVPFSSRTWSPRTRRVRTGWHWKMFSVAQAHLNTSMALLSLY